MDDDVLLRRLASLDLAVADLTEAVEELAKSLDPTTSPKLSLVESHLRDIRENFNQLASRRSAT
jgi:hypothetical protein